MSLLNLDGVEFLRLFFFDSAKLGKKTQVISLFALLFHIFNLIFNEKKEILTEAKIGRKKQGKHQRDRRDDQISSFC